MKLLDPDTSKTYRQGDTLPGGEWELLGYTDDTVLVRRIGEDFWVSALPPGDLGLVITNGMTVAQFARTLVG